MCASHAIMIDKHDLPPMVDFVHVFVFFFARSWLSGCVLVMRKPDGNCSMELFGKYQLVT